MGTLCFVRDTAFKDLGGKARITSDTMSQSGIQINHLAPVRLPNTEILLDKSRHEICKGKLFCECNLWVSCVQSVCIYDQKMGFGWSRGVLYSERIWLQINLRKVQASMQEGPRHRESATHQDRVARSSTMLASPVGTTDCYTKCKAFKISKLSCTEAANRHQELNRHSESPQSIEVSEDSRSEPSYGWDRSDKGALAS